MNLIKKLESGQIKKTWVLEKIKWFIMLIRFINTIKCNFISKFGLEEDYTLILQRYL
jgi:hypothetical protein